MISKEVQIKYNMFYITKKCLLYILYRQLFENSKFEILNLLLVQSFTKLDFSKIENKRMGIYSQIIKLTFSFHQIFIDQVI